MTRFYLTLATLGVIVCGVSCFASGADQRERSSGPTPEQMQVGPVPVWIDVEPAPTSRPRTVRDELDDDGIAYLLIDERVDLASETRYFRSVREITSADGLEAASRVEVSFDPTYQRLVWHSVIVRRGDRELERLDGEKIEVSRRYDELEWNIYDNSFTAFLLLDDLRVGDVVDVQYSIIGFNPVFGRKYGHMTFLNWTVPVGLVIREFHVPRGRRLHYKLWEGAPEPEVTETVTGTHLVWRVRDTPAVDFEFDAPDAWDARARVQVSEFNSWAEVVEWALPLYPEVEFIGEQLRAITSHVPFDNAASPEEAVRLLQFVQEDVRYLSVAVGESSHRPSHPVDTATRRFGDCKDKAYLFCALMRARGIRAVPALVNTAWSDGIGDMLPMPQAFDHVIVRIEGPDGRMAWVDPTRSHQGGSLYERVVDRYALALPLTPGATALERIVMPPAAADVTEVTETFRLGKVTESAILDVITTYRGQAADRMRSRFASTRRKDLSDAFIEYYSSEYAEVSEAAPFEVSDDRAANVIELRETYKIERIWSRDGDDEPYKISFYPTAVREWLDRPGRTDRVAPYEIRHPIKVTQRTTVHLPEIWPDWTTDESIQNRYFSVNTRARIQQRSFTYTAAYESRERVVPAAEVPQFARDVDRSLRELGYELTWSPDAADSLSALNLQNVHWGRLALGPVLFAGFLGGFMAWAFLPMGRPPLMRRRMSGPEGLGGWLILLVCGFVLRLLFAVAGFVQAAPTYFSRTTWNAAVQTVEASRRWHVEAALWFEMISIYAIVACSIVFLIAFFRRHRSAPRLGLTGFSLGAFSAAVSCYALFLLPAATFAERGASVRNLTAAIVGGLLWSTYLFTSRRVENTFRR